MNSDLLAKQLEERILHEGATHGLGSLRKKLIELLDVVAAGNAQEFQHRLVVFETQNCLVAYGLSILSGVHGVEWRKTYCRGT